MSEITQARLIHLMGVLMFAAEEAERLGLWQTALRVYEAVLQMRYELLDRNRTPTFFP